MSIAVLVNWFCNFIVGIVFLPMKVRHVTALSRHGIVTSPHVTSRHGSVVEMAKDGALAASPTQLVSARTEAISNIHIIR